MNRVTWFSLLLLAGSACADERILDYRVQISIEPDACMRVSEAISVRAEGDQIRHGIYRDFPTDYRDVLGHHYRVAFDMLGAQRDGNTEEWREQRKGNGIRVYLGSASTEVAAGEHAYRLSYRTCRQIGFFGDHDELYWNVTGNGWAFPIDATAAELTLPYHVPEDRLHAFGYTGAQGSREQALETETYESGARFRATRGLAPSEGLSVVLEFPKGVLAAPTREQRLLWLLQDNLTLAGLLVGLVLLWLYYGWAWRSYGRDPAPGVRIPLYEPPKGFSPASLRFVRQMGYDRNCFAAALLGLAAKGWLDIDQDASDSITLRRTGREVEFAPGERELAFKLLPGSSDSLELKQSDDTAALMKAAQKSHRQALAGDYERKYFLTHREMLIPGWLISVVTLIATIVPIPGADIAAALGTCIWLSGWSFGVYALVSQALTASRGAHGVFGGVGAAFLWLFAVPFIAGECIGLYFLGTLVGAGPVLGLVILIGTNIAFLHWMKAPTLSGAKLLDQIEGFRWYLGVAEKQELDSRYKPEARPELFSEYLPYAFALGVEQAWAQRFADALPRDQVDRLQPTWYHGSAWNSSSLTGFTSGLASSLSSSISSASSTPGSSSGSSGGSGGGGGGGGGGGW